MYPLLCPGGALWRAEGSLGSRTSLSPKEARHWKLRHLRSTQPTRTQVEGIAPCFREMGPWSSHPTVNWNRSSLPWVPEIAGGGIILRQPAMVSLSHCKMGKDPFSISKNLYPMFLSNKWLLKSTNWKRIMKMNWKSLWKARDLNFSLKFAIWRNKRVSGEIVTLKLNKNINNMFILMKNIVINKAILMNKSSSMALHWTSIKENLVVRHKMKPITRLVNNLWRLSPSSYRMLQNHWNLHRIKYSDWINKKLSFLMR